MALAACNSGSDQQATAILISEVAGDTQSVYPELSVPVSPAVRVTRAGSPVAGDTVTFEITDAVPGPGGGRVSGASQVTGVDGLATVGDWIPGNTGRHTLQASIAGSAAMPVTFTAFSVQFNVVVQTHAGNNQTATAGQRVAIAPQVLVEKLPTGGFDLVPVAGDTVIFAVGQGGGTVTGDTVITGTDGLAAVGSWTLGPTPGTNTLLVKIYPYPADVRATFTATGQ